MDFQQCSEINWTDWYFKYTDSAITTKWLDLQPFSHPYIKEKYLGSHTFPWVYPESITISRLSTKIYVLSFTSWGPSILNCLQGLEVWPCWRKCASGVVLEVSKSHAIPSVFSLCLSVLWLWIKMWGFLSSTLIFWNQSHIKWFFYKFLLLWHFTIAITKN